MFAQTYWVKLGVLSSIQYPKHSHSYSHNRVVALVCLSLDGLPAWQGGYQSRETHSMFRSYNPDDMYDMYTLYDMCDVYSI